MVHFVKERFFFSSDDPEPFDFGDEEGGSLDRVICRLLEVRRLIPPDQRKEASCVIRANSSDEGEASLFIEVSYLRPETYGEVCRREEREKEQEKMLKIISDCREREERELYEKLKRKYGD